MNRLYEVVYNGKGPMGRAYAITLAVIIILNVIVVFLGTFNIDSSVNITLECFDIATAIIFSVDYILRIIIAPLVYPKNKHPRLRYIFSFMGIIDLLSVLPFYIPMNVDLRTLRLLRILQLLRILKLTHFSNGLRTVGIVLKNKKTQLLSSIAVIAILIVIAASIMYEVESNAQPTVFKNGFDALWWAIATLTTVGYGDIFPITSVGKLMSAIIAILGIGIVAVPSGIIAAGFTENSEDDRDEKMAQRIAELVKTTITSSIEPSQ